MGDSPLSKRTTVDAIVNIAVASMGACLPIKPAIFVFNKPLHVLHTRSHSLISDAVLPISQGELAMMRPAKVDKFYLSTEAVDFRKLSDGTAARVG